MLESDLPVALRQAMLAVRNGGVLSVPGVYSGFIDKVPFGSVMNRSITIKTGQTHVQRYLKPLLQRIENGEIDPGFVITHRFSLNQAPEGFRMPKVLSANSRSSSRASRRTSPPSKAWRDFTAAFNSAAVPSQLSLSMRASA
ncbi:MAG: hypothetical protein ABI759_13505 [Candidatus Solibacter sp.]